MNRPPQVIVGAKLPLKPMHVWAIRVRLQIERRLRDLALFDVALDSKLRGCDVVSLRVCDVLAAGALRRRAIVIQQKTGRPVQFELTEQAAAANGLAQDAARRILSLGQRRRAAAESPVR